MTQPSNPARYYSQKEAAELCGITKQAFIKRGAPRPDVLVGEVQGWTRETLEAWNAEWSRRRPGRPRRTTTDGEV